MASRDRPLLEALKGLLGYGCINDAPPRQAHWEAMSTLCIASNKAHHSATIPFAERYLLPSAKREQFERGANGSTNTNGSVRVDTAKARHRVLRRDAIVRFAAVDSADPTTTVPPVTELAAYLGGFTAAEGCFVCTDDGTRFSFAVGLGATDIVSCQLLSIYFGVGRIQRSPRRSEHQDDEVCFAVRSLRELVEVVVPFMDEHLPPSYKRTQYEAWRTRLLDYWEHDAKRVRPCSVEGCERPRRAKGLCRSHYYAAFGG